MNSGYLIPENAQPADTRCLRVFVPDDPLYMAAFLGALTYFGQWTAWERDTEKRGKFAAHAWREANDLTIDGLSLPCGDNPITDEEMSDILDKLEEINNRLSEIEDMNVTVTQTVNGCGCGDGTTTTTTNQTDGIIINPDDTGIVPPYMTDPVVIVDSVRCRSANYMASSLSSMLRKLESLGGMAGGLIIVVGVIALVVTTLSPVLGDEVITWSAFIVWARQAVALGSATGFVSYQFRRLAELIEDDLQSLTCALYHFDNAAELGNTIATWINARIDELQAEEEFPIETAVLFKKFVNAVIGPEMINWFVENVESVVPAEFVPEYDCRCGATGDSCPTQNLVLAGVGSLAAGDLSGSTQGFASEFNGQTGYHEIIFELAANYCVTIDNGSYTPTEAHEKCDGGVMVASDGTCIRRFTARSQSPFATAVEFTGQTVDCSCQDWTCLVPDGDVVDMVPVSLVKTESQCDNVSVDSFVVNGNQVSMTFTITPGECTLGKFDLTLSSTEPHIRAWLFDNIVITGETPVLFDGISLTVGASTNGFARTNHDWEDCIELAGYVLTSNNPRSENNHVFRIQVERGDATRTYTITMGVRGINDLSL